MPNSLDPVILFLREKPLWTFEGVASIGLSLAKLMAIRTMLARTYCSLLVNDQELKIIHATSTRKDLSEEEKTSLERQKQQVKDRYRNNFIFFLLRRLEEYMVRECGEDYKTQIAQLPTSYLSNEIYNQSDFKSVARRFKALRSDQSRHAFQQLVELNYCTLTDAEDALTISCGDHSDSLNIIKKQSSFLALNEEQQDLVSRSRPTAVLFRLGLRLEQAMILDDRSRRMLYTSCPYSLIALHENEVMTWQLAAIKQVKSFHKCYSSSEIFLWIIQEKYNTTALLHKENGSGVFSFLMELLKTDCFEWLQTIPELLWSHSYRATQQYFNIINNPIVWLLTITATQVRGFPSLQKFLFNFIKTNPRANIFALNGSDIVMSYFWCMPAVLEAIAYRNTELQTEIGHEVIGRFTSSDAINSLGKDHFDYSLKEERINLLTHLMYHNQAMQNRATRTVRVDHSRLEFCILKIARKFYSISEIIPLLHNFTYRHHENRKVLLNAGVTSELIADLHGLSHLTMDRVALGVVLLWSLLPYDQKAQEKLISVNNSGFTHRLILLLQDMPCLHHMECVEITAAIIHRSVVGILSMLARNPDQVELIRYHHGFEIIKNWEWPKSRSIEKDGAAFKLLRRDSEAYTLSRHGLFRGERAVADSRQRIPRSFVEITVR